MPIKIRQTPYERTGAFAGPYQVFPDDVLAQLGVIAMAGTDELPESLGDAPDPGDANLSVVSYDPGPQDAATRVGRIRQLIKDLVDGPRETRLMGVGPDFYWDDGTTLEQSAGAEIGSWILYDAKNCDGDGRWVRGTDGEEVCTTSAGILFHELGHVRLGHPAGTPDHDERAAVGVENDLREAQGLVPRDPDHWGEADCGCPGNCCIVASVATGSPYSPQVHALRRLRDYRLRTTQFGHHLFDIIHTEYYTFSVPICRVMVMDRGAQKNVENWLVKPLVRAFQLLAEYDKGIDDAKGLGELISEDHEQGFLIGVSEMISWDDLRQLLAAASAGEKEFGRLVELDSGTKRIVEILAESLPRCPHVRWGIVDLLIIYASARAQFQSMPDRQAVGTWLKEAFDNWVSNIPLEYVLAKLSLEELMAELPQLGTTMFTRPHARQKFGARLTGALKSPPDPNFAEQLRDGGYVV